MIVFRKATSAAAFSTSTWKYDRVKLKTVDASSSSARTASTTTRPSRFRRASSSGSERSPAGSGRRCRPLVPEEDGRRTRPSRSRRAPDRLEMGVQLFRGEPRVARGVLPPDGEGVRLEDRQRAVAVPDVPDVVSARSRRRRERGRDLRRDELDPGVDADGLKDPAGGRVEERLRQLDVHPSRRSSSKAPFIAVQTEGSGTRRPRRAVSDSTAGSRSCGRAQPLEGVGLQARPVAGGEARRGPARDLPNPSV